MNEPIAVYVHTPFCPSKCGYCDFNSYAMSGDIVSETVEAITYEVRQSRYLGRPAKTIFFGGGTPTFLSAEQLVQLLEAVLEAHPPVPAAEVTTEANPGTVNLAKLKRLRTAGFNRLSLGAQSFDTSDLLRLGRVHGPAEIGQAMESAREAGFDNVNLDLMFGLPGQPVRSWNNNLELALRLGPDHLSLYGLTIEPNTRFFRYHLRGMLDLPSEEAQISMYEAAIAACESKGMVHYEISNFSMPGRECQHNLCYWRTEEYIGYGPGAVGRVDGVRETNMKHPARYIEALRLGSNLACESEVVNEDTLALERLMLGLRLAEGLPESTPTDPRGHRKAVDSGLLQVEGGRIRLTARGRLLHTEVATMLA